MKLPIQSQNIMRNTFEQAVKRQAIYPAQFSPFFPSFGGLRFCYCRTSLDECKLFLGTEETCNNCGSCLPTFPLLSL